MNETFFYESIAFGVLCSQQIGRQQNNFLKHCLFENVKRKLPSSSLMKKHEMKTICSKESQKLFSLAFNLLAGAVAQLVRAPV